MTKMTKGAARFVAANKRFPVVAGAAYEGGGGRYTFANGDSLKLTLEDARALPEGYPVWPWDFGPEKQEAE